MPVGAQERKHFMIRTYSGTEIFTNEADMITTEVIQRVITQSKLQTQLWFFYCAHPLTVPCTVRCFEAKYFTVLKNQSQQKITI